MKIPSPLQEITTRWSLKAGVNLLIKRDDLIHPQISGNKYRKLKYNLLAAKESGYDTILSFGGAFSNHIHALSIASNKFGFKSIGIIRGEETRPLNPTLAFAEKQGMQLHWVTRASYRDKAKLEFIQGLKDRFGEFYLVPEGGTNTLAINGTSEIIPEIDISFDYICVSIGSGGTIAGLIESCPANSKVLGFSSLKGDFIKKEVKSILVNDEPNNYRIFTDFHFGGYAKVKPELWDFMDDFYTETSIQLEPIYTGKMMMGIKKLCDQGFFKNGDTIVAIHTGGLQGLLGFNR